METKTDDKNIEKLIDCYSPVLYGDFDLMKKHMLEVSETWKEKEKVFKRAIRYILNNDKGIKETNIGDLAEMLLQAIENRMPKYCLDCDKWYVARRGSKPKIFCTWCKVGMHNCKKIDGIEKLNGFRWFCKECDEQFLQQFQPKMVKIKNTNFKGFNKNEDIMNQNKAMSEKKINKNKKVVNDVEIIDLKDGEKKDDESITPKNIEPKEDKPETDAQGTKKTCWFWVNRKCKFGNQCKDDHPVQCKSMMETGRCSDSRCKLIHPKICRGVYYEGYCSRRNCWYVHPTNIVNRYVFRDMNTTYNNSKNNNNNRSNPHSHNPNTNLNNSQTGWSNGNQNQNFQYNQTSNRNTPTFLDQWPTPWETSRSAKMLISKIMEEVTAKIMSI